MSDEKMSGENRKRVGRWGFFLLGFAVGIAITISVFIMNRIWPENTQLVATIIEPIKTIEEEPPPIEEIQLEEKRRKVVQNKSVDTLDETLDILKIIDDYEFPELDYAEVDFFIDTEVTEEIFLFDRIINSRQITTRDLSTTDSLNRPLPPFQTFEVQQWSTPIRNSITYQRKGHILKIKGLDINSIDIFYRNGEYYLQYKNSNYIIPENHSFERLVEKMLSSKS